MEGGKGMRGELVPPLSFLLCFTYCFFVLDTLLKVFFLTPTNAKKFCHLCIVFQEGGSVGEGPEFTNSDRGGEGEKMGRAGKF